ncbi:hypothetical protein CWE12_03510 [Aliidiomarina sedimenti]|uniref:DUF1289 domain-containing protein n=1 Tax=Aliidiomarina sedimenti TaxID=1933879 RepID=A0ABY0C329_9GAMM|nr:DUF1289 domain-containing protein [Aliidiomarina sedimenti]RUO32068.1 hypothetical protein CWE12_03510 [Aliidiomarina sedimenti]
MAANQLELFHLPNPCIGVCESNSKGYCKGCLRSRSERFNWHQKSEQEQRLILNKLTQRRARLRQQMHKASPQDDQSRVQQIDLFDKDL